MTFRSCPRCHRHSLYSNGAFWTCSVCRYAITESALLIDERRALRRANQPPESSG
jgi:ribosomal protein L37AE/L43A